MKVVVRVFFTALLILSSTVLFAQVETGTIAGTVRDQSGAVLPNIAVTLTNVNTGRALSASSNAAGEYTFTALPPGTYELKIEPATNFGPFTQRAQVTVGGRLTLDPVLRVSGTTTTVEVVGAGGVEVNTQDQSLSNVVNIQALTQLPTISRDPYDLVATSGNVSEGDTA